MMFIRLCQGLAVEATLFFACVKKTSKLEVVVDLSGAFHGLSGLLSYYLCLCLRSACPNCVIWNGTPFFTTERWNYTTGCPENVKMMPSFRNRDDLSAENSLVWIWTNWHDMGTTPSLHTCFEKIKPLHLTWSQFSSIGRKFNDLGILYDVNRRRIVVTR